MRTDMKEQHRWGIPSGLVFKRRVSGWKSLRTRKVLRPASSIKVCGVVLSRMANAKLAPKLQFASLFVLVLLLLSLLWESYKTKKNHYAKSMDVRKSGTYSFKFLDGVSGSLLNYFFNVFGAHFSFSAGTWKSTRVLKSQTKFPHLY